MSRFQHAAIIPLILFCIARPAFALKRSELVPPDVKFEIHVSNTASFWEMLKKSSLGKLWMDQQFQDFIGNPDQEVWTEIFFDGEQSAEDKILVEQLKMIKGEVIIAFPQNHDDDPLIIANMSAEDFAHSLILDDKIKEVGKEPLDIVKDSFQGIELIQHISSPGTDQESRSFQAYLNNTVIMGPDRAWVEQSIMRLKEEPVAEPEGNPVLNLELPLARLIKDSLDKETKGGNAAGGVNTEALYDSLGLLGIESFSARVELMDDGLVVDNNLVAGSLNKGIFTILNMAPVEIPAVGFVPENITMLEVARIDLLRFWQEIPVVLLASMPEARPQFDMVMGIIRQQTGIDLELDLLSHLGNRYLSFSFFENNMLINVMALELRDGSAFKRGLETVLNAPALQPQVNMAFDTVDFLDHTLYVSKSTEPGDTIAFAVTGNHFLYGQPEGVRQVIRSESSETARSARFEQSELVQGLRRHTPSSAFGCSAIDWEKNMGFIVRELANPHFSNMLLGRWATSGIPLPPPDLNKLPPADHLASFFNKSYQYVEKTDRGIHQKIILKY